MIWWRLQFWKVLWWLCLCWCRRLRHHATRKLTELVCDSATGDIATGGGAGDTIGGGNLNINVTGGGAGDIAAADCARG